MCKMGVFIPKPLKTKNPEPRFNAIQGYFDCTPVGIRTPNLLIRSQMLYPIELRVQLYDVKSAQNESTFNQEYKNSNIRSECHLLL